MSGYSFKLLFPDVKGDDTNVVEFTDVGKMREFVYFVLETRAESRIILQITEDGELIKEFSDRLTLEVADTILIWCFAASMGVIRYETTPRIEHDMKRIRNYITKIAKESHAAFTKVFLAGETMDYAAVIHGGVLYTFLMCDAKDVAGKMMCRLRNNIRTHLPYRLKQNEDPLLLDKRFESNFIVATVLSEYRKVELVLHLNEMSIRRQMAKSHIYLRTSLIDNIEEKYDKKVKSS